MKRGIISTLLAACLAVCLFSAAFMAEQPTVTYDGSKITYNYADTNQFGSAFENMVPGENQNTGDPSGPIPPAKKPTSSWTPPLSKPLKTR